MNQQSGLASQFKYVLKQSVSSGSGRLVDMFVVSNEVAPRYAGLSSLHSSPYVCAEAIEPNDNASRPNNRIDVIIDLILLPLEESCCVLNAYTSTVYYDTGYGKRLEKLAYIST